MIILFRLPPEALVLLIPSLVFALSFHEYAHAWMAHKCGDNTAAKMGRLSMNPIAHLDPMGSLMILFVGFGWAKPVPVDSRFLRKPRTDMMKVAAAGPMANLILAFISGMILRIFPIDDLGQVINKEMKTTMVVASGELINQIKMRNFYTFWFTR